MSPEPRIERIAESAIGAAYRRSLVRCGAHGIVFGTDSEVVEAWPRSYLDPACRFETAAPDTRPQVSVVVSADLYAAAEEALREIPAVSASTYEGTPARRHALGDGRFALAYRARAGLTIVDPGRGEAVYLAPATVEPPHGGPNEPPFEAARLIREMLRRQAEHAGAMVVHAGAVVVDSGAWIVSGAKGAGKTTLVCSLVEYRGADFIANDRVFLARTGGGFDVRPWPMTIRIGIGTCLASGGLRPWLRPASPPVYPQTEWDPVAGISAGEAAAIASDGGGPKVELVVPEFVGSLGSTAAEHAALAGVLLPAWNRDLDRPALRPVPRAEAIARLWHEALTPDDPAYPDWLELRRRKPAEIRTHAERLIGDIAAGLPVYEVAFSTGRDAAEACAAVLGGGAGTGGSTESGGRP